MEYIYKVKNLSFQYPQKSTYSIEDITLNIKKGDFTLLMGLSGSGKSTLLKHLKSILMPNGNRKGEILFENNLIENISFEKQVTKIGYVSQNPDNQIVTDKVWHELAFGLESLGYKSDDIRIKVSEIASFFGIQKWFHKNVNELSGGQKQLLNLASVMTMNPSVLILDEPTSQLDPIAGKEFLDTLKKINDELGITIILSEQRLEEVLPISNHVVLMDNGKILIDEREVHNLPIKIKKLNHPIFYSLPTPCKLFTQLENDYNSPLTIKDAKNWFEEFCKNKYIEHKNNEKQNTSNETILSLKDIYFKYENNDEYTIKGLSLDIKKGEIFSILGGNGSGKSTTLSLISGLKIPNHGKIFINNENIDNIPITKRFKNLLAFLPQNPQDIFARKTVIEELKDGLKKSNYPLEIKNQKLNKIIDLCDLKNILKQHPYDISGGEQQRVALAKVLLLEPKILLLDEATKGLDGYFKIQLAKILKNLQILGVTIIMVSHDIEFCAKYSDRCAMFFDGNAISINNPTEFFSGNRFYTTATNRIAQNLLPKAIIENDIFDALNIIYEDDFYDKTKVNFENNNSNNENIYYENLSVSKNKSNPTLNNLIKKNNNNINFKNILFGIAVIIATFLLLKSKYNDENYKYIINALLILELIITVRFSFPDKEIDIPDYLIQQNHSKRKLTKRTIIASFIISILIPITIYFGIFYLNDRKYLFISFLIILETFIPFLLIFESRKPQAKEIVLISVLISIAVASRSAFFMLQNFKPLMAIVIISGVCLGGEVGFLVGSASMLVSNIFMGQGPWTPWQMFTAGIIGFIAGILFRKGLLRKKKSSLCLFSFISVFIIHCLIMNFASVVMWYPNPSPEIFMLYYIKGIPFDLIYACATTIFMWLISKPMIEKIERIKIKYGILQD